MAGLLSMLSEEGGASKGAPAPDLKTEVAQDLIDAVQGGDAASVASAFQRMYDACAMRPGKASGGAFPAELDEE